MIQYYDSELLKHIINHREGETKLGEVISCFDPNIYFNENSSTIQYAIIGISESIGVAENKGIQGTETTWNNFLSAFLNTQANEFIQAKSILLYGCIANIDNLTALDDIVKEHVQFILSQNWIPIVVGGGHNNAYPILHALSTQHKSAINCINIDPHADLRVANTRHSGNGFSYAKNYGFLHKYAILGLHQQYNNQFIIDLMKTDKDIFPIWWEEIFLQAKYSWASAIENAIKFVDENIFGLEIDLDAIENTLTSAMTPVGINAQQACQAVYIISMHPNCKYLHLPEGIYERADGLKQLTIGKLLSYLILSFIKGKQ